MLNIVKFFNKVNHFIKRRLFKNLKYEFEEFIPNSAGRPKDINSLIKININNLTASLKNVSTFFKSVNIQNINSIDVNKEMCENLEALFNNYGSDKATHGYHILYAKIFEKISDNPTILEIGVGSNNTYYPSNMGIEGFPGASLRVFSNLYPDSEIFGADIDKDILNDFENVKMFYLDQNILDTYNNKIINQKYFDLIIDDGLHMQSANLNTLFFSLGRLKKSGFLIIEDVSISTLNVWYAVNSILKHPYELSIYKCFDNYAVVIELKDS